MLIKNNVRDNDRICIIADFLGKPKSSNKFYRPEIKTSPVVYNATMLESHASLFIQLVDVIIGCIVYDFKKKRETFKKYDVFKLKVCNFLKEKLGIETLAESLSLHKPNDFCVREV